MKPAYENDLALGLRLWLEEGHLCERRAIMPVVNIGELKRNAAQRLMAAQRTTK